MIRIAITIALMISAFAWGLAAGTYKLFPFTQLQALQDMVRADDPREGAGYRDNPLATERGLELADWDTQAEVVMIGDSITEMAPWKDMFPDADILNRGASGDTVGGVEKRLDAILRAEPRHAFVLIGTNDLNLENPVDETLEIYARVVARLQSAGVEVTLQTVPPCEPSLDPCTAQRRASEAALNKGIAALARRQGTNLVDLAVEFPRGTEYRPDGVHPSMQGFKAWRDVLKPHVETVLKKEQTK